MTSKSDIQTKGIVNLSNKDRLEQAFAIGMNRPDLKKDEKMHFLGEFRERVIKRLTKNQVAYPLIFPEIMKALQDKRSIKMLLNGNISIKFTDKYIQLAKKVGKPFTSIHNPELKGETGLVVISDQAVDIANIEVEDITK